MRYLIVTADDFGLTRGTNEGIAKAYTDGIVTSVGFLPTGEAFEDALGFTENLKLDGIVAHLALTETEPLSDPATIASLVTKDGAFYRSYRDLLLKFFLGKVSPAHIYTELKGQLEALKKVGIPIVNMSSHEHIHMVPEILKIFVRLAREYNIPSIRYPRECVTGGRFDFGRLYRQTVLSYFAKGMKPILDSAHVVYTDHLLGFLDSGDLAEEKLIDMLRWVGEGVTELVSHPGFLGREILTKYRFHMDCEAELYALTSPRVDKALDRNKISLITYREFLSLKHR